jgi:hypothetical protein
MQKRPRGQTRIKTNATEAKRSNKNKKNATEAKRNVNICFSQLLFTFAFHICFSQAKGQKHVKHVKHVKLQM